MDTYPHTVRSALRRVRRLLIAHGYQLGRTVGRYHPIGGHDDVIPGPNVSRVGCSRKVSLHYFDPKGSRGFTRRAEWLPGVLEALRADGLPFDDVGWMTCDWE